MTPKLLGVAFAAFFIGALPAAADDTFIAEQKLTEYLAKDRLIGANVHDKVGKIIGHVNDLIVDGDNKIVGAIISAGGVLGIGKKDVAVPLASLGIEFDRRRHQRGAADRHQGSLDRGTGIQARQAA